MNKNGIAIPLLIGSVYQWFYPAYGGLLGFDWGFTLGEGRIVAWIMLAAGLILLYIPEEQ